MLKSNLVKIRIVKWTASLNSKIINRVENVKPLWYKGTLDSGINVGVRLLFFEKNGRKKNMKNDGNALIDVKMN